MLEIRYKKTTGQLTGWWASRFGNHEIKLRERPDEAIVTLDIGIPDKPLEAWLYDEATQSLVPNPDYTEPVARNLVAEIDDLKARIEALEAKLEIRRVESK